jgi:hypothetical protein
MQVGVDPGGHPAARLLHDFMGRIPVPGGIVPERAQTGLQPVGAGTGI